MKLFSSSQTITNEGGNFIAISDITKHSILKVDTSTTNYLSNASTNIGIITNGVGASNPTYIVKKIDLNGVETGAENSKPVLSNRLYYTEWKAKASGETHNTLILKEFELGVNIGGEGLIEKSVDTSHIKDKAVTKAKLADEVINFIPSNSIFEIGNNRVITFKGKSQTLNDKSILFTKSPNYDINSGEKFAYNSVQYDFEVRKSSEQAYSPADGLEQNTFYFVEFNANKFKFTKFLVGELGGDSVYGIIKFEGADRILEPTTGKAQNITNNVTSYFFRDTSNVRNNSFKLRKRDGNLETINWKYRKIDGTLSTTTSLQILKEYRLDKTPTDWIVSDPSVATQLQDKIVTNQKLADHTIHLDKINRDVAEKIVDVELVLDPLNNNVYNLYTPGTNTHVTLHTGHSYSIQHLQINNAAGIKFRDSTGEKDVKSLYFDDITKTFKHSTPTFGYIHEFYYNGTFCEADIGKIDLKELSQSHVLSMYDVVLAKSLNTERVLSNSKNIACLGFLLF